MSQQGAASRRYPANAARCLSRRQRERPSRTVHLPEQGHMLGSDSRCPCSPSMDIFCLMLSHLPAEWSAHTAPGAPVVQLHACFITSGGVPVSSLPCML